MAIEQPRRIDVQRAAVGFRGPLRDIARAVDVGADGHFVLVGQTRQLSGRADAAQLHGLAQAVRSRLGWSSQA